MFSILATLLAVSFALSTAEEPRTVTGTVRDPDGNPVADARVYLLTQIFSHGEELAGETESNAAGEFSVLLSQDEPVTSPRGIRLVAVKPGMAIGGQYLRASELAEQVALTAHPTAPMTVRVLDPDGQPVPGASVAIQTIRTDEKVVGIGSVDGRLARKTNAAGEVELDLCEELTHWVTIQAAGFGLQTVMLSAVADKLDMTLGKVGRIQGRLTGLESWSEPFPIFVRSERVAPPETSQAAGGSAKAKTNDQGEFEIPEILAGEVHLSVALTPESRLRHQQTTVTLPAGETVTVEIELAVANRLVGTVRDRETKQPVAGVSMLTYSPRWGGHSATTDECGKYSVQVLPGACQLELVNVPSPYIRPSGAWRRVTIGEDFQDGQELPDALFELERGVSVSGRVQDPQGKPVDEAEVLATWMYREGSLMSFRTTQATSDLQGEFVLTDVSRNTTLRVTARAETAGTLEPVEIAAAATEPLMLTAAPEGVLWLSGRVVDEEGGSIAGAQLQLRVQQQDEHGHLRSSSDVKIPGGLTTDETGRFRVPQTLLRSADVRFEVRAEGFLTATAAVTLPIADEPEFTVPEIVLKRVGTLRGRAVDRQGNPLSGVTVSASRATGGSLRSTRSVQPLISTQTDVQGRFHLENVDPTGWFVYADKPSYRFTGAPRISGHFDQSSDRSIGAQGPEIELRLSRLDEPPLLRIEPVKHRWSLEKRRELLTQLWQQVDALPVASEFEYLRSQVLTYLVGVDDTLVEERLERITSPHLLVPVLIRMMRLDEALEVAQEDADEYRRFHLILEIYDATPDNVAKKNLLAEALVTARGIHHPAQRVAALTQVAEKLLDLGEQDTAEQIVGEARPVARELAVAGWSGFIRSRFAEVLAVFNQKEALKLIRELTPEREQSRHVGNIAHKLARVQPAEAERALAMLESAPSSDYYGVRVCYRMAQVDLERAVRIAESIGQGRVRQPDGSRESGEPVYQPFAFAAMAHSLAEDSPEKSRELLRRAAELLWTVDDPGDLQTVSRRRVPPLGHRLVRWSEFIDLDSTAEYLWRALHAIEVTGPMRDWNTEWLPEQRQRRASMLSLLARYGLFPDETRLWITAVKPPIEEFAKSSLNEDAALAIAAWTMLEPEQVLAWHGELLKLAGEPDNRTLRVYPQPTAIIARVLAGDKDDLFDFIDRYTSRLWIPDREDF